MLNQIEDIKDTVFKYIETRIDLFKIETRDKIERAVVMAVYGAIVLCIALTILILVVILLGTFLNRWLNSDYLGFAILLAFFSTLLAVSVYFKEGLIRFIRNTIVKVISVKEEVSTP